MTATVVRFLAIALTGLALIPAGAHAMEYLNKIQLPAQNYLIVQGNYRGWSLAAVLVVGAFAATLALSVVLRRRPGFLSAVIA